jgi:transcriptional regulator with XRE-family HTH domain
MPTILKRRPRRGSRSGTDIAAAISKAKALTDGNKVAALRLLLALPRIKFARLLGRTERAIIDWESGKADPQGLSRQRFHELERLTEALRGLLKADALGEWFDTANSAFSGLKPIEVIERGESDRLWQMIFELRAGTHL